MLIASLSNFGDNLYLMRFDFISGDWELKRGTDKYQIYNVARWHVYK